MSDEIHKMLRDEVEHHRRARLEVVERNLELEAEVDILRGRIANLETIAKQTADLTGAGWCERLASNNGQIWARPAAEVEEDRRRFWIRNAAAQCLPRAIDRTDSLDSAIRAAINMGYALWRGLENNFAADDEAKAAAEARAEADTESEGG